MLLVRHKPHRKGKFREETETNSKVISQSSNVRKTLVDREAERRQCDNISLLLFFRIKFRLI